MESTGRRLEFKIRKSILKAVSIHIQSPVDASWLVSVAVNMKAAVRLGYRRSDILFGTNHVERKRASLPMIVDPILASHQWLYYACVLQIEVIPWQILRRKEESSAGCRGKNATSARLPTGFKFSGTYDDTDPY